MLTANLMLNNMVPRLVYFTTKIKKYYKDNMNDITGSLLTLAG